MSQSEAEPDQDPTTEAESYGDYSVDDEDQLSAEDTLDGDGDPLDRGYRVAERLQGSTAHGVTAGEQAQGPGFTEEGSYELGEGIRMHDQRLGEDHTSGPARVPQDETSN